MQPRFFVQTFCCRQATTRFPAAGQQISFEHSDFVYSSGFLGLLLLLLQQQDARLMDFAEQTFEEKEENAKLATGKPNRPAAPKSPFPEPDQWFKGHMYWSNGTRIYPPDVPQVPTKPFFSCGFNEKPEIQKEIDHF